MPDLYYYFPYTKCEKSRDFISILSNDNCNKCMGRGVNEMSHPQLRVVYDLVCDCVLKELDNVKVIG